MLNKMLYKKRIERHEQCICAHPIVDGPLTLEAVVEFCHQILGSFNRPVRPKSNEVSSSIKRRHCETLRIYKWILFIRCSENERNLNIVLCNQVTSKSILFGCKAVLYISAFLLDWLETCDVSHRLKDFKERLGCSHQIPMRRHSHGRDQQMPWDSWDHLVASSLS